MRFSLFANALCDPTPQTEVRTKKQLPNLNRQMTERQTETGVSREAPPLKIEGVLCRMRCWAERPEQVYNGHMEKL